MNISTVREKNIQKNTCVNSHINNNQDQINAHSMKSNQVNKYFIGVKRNIYFSGVDLISSSTLQMQSASPISV